MPCAAIGGIENKLHWVLDTTMNEDACQIYRGNATENLACCRHISLNMLKAEKTKKTSIRRKQGFATKQTDYLDAILHYARAVVLGSINKHSRSCPAYSMALTALAKSSGSQSANIPDSLIIDKGDVVLFP